LLPVGGFGWDLHLLLPALVLSARPLAQITRVTYITVSEILSQDYVRTAHSKGMPDGLVMVRHVLVNAAVPVLTTLGVSLRYSLVSLPVVELFFGWPGIGFTLLKAISKQDDNLTVILILSLGTLFILVNLLLDLIYRLIDPQLRAIPEHISVERGESVLRVLNTFLRELPRVLKAFISRGRSPSTKEQQPEAWFTLDKQAEEDQAQYDAADRSVRRTWIQGTLKNPSLIVGSLFILGLLGLILFSPNLAPHSPYTTQGLTFVDGKFLVPPFAPDTTYPLGTDVLGRDILSLIIAGAQQTMFLAVLVVLARMLIGFALGALAGWANGSWLDRFIIGVAEVIAAFPALLLAMILILALGIRNGIQPFIIALCFVGWGEIMQFVRSEVMNIQTKLYIESAVAAGLNSLKIVFRHVLPNLASALISISALEMGAVLMLLGELGFIGIFIGAAPCRARYFRPSLPLLGCA
jgi:ABC-type dipeptide/oligopeptide/nickel transport system permease subunit